ncbi:MAG: hypothetical protein ACT443_03635 [Gemmatimonadota bacterium]
MTEIPPERREQLLAKRAALQHQINVQAELEKVRSERERMDERGVEYELIHRLQPEYEKLMNWYFAAFPMLEWGEDIVPDWPRVQTHEIGPWFHDPRAGEWLPHLAHAKDIGRAPVFVVHGGGFPHIVISFEDLTKHFDIFSRGIDKYFMCPEEGWAIAGAGNDRWGWGRANPSSVEK